MARQGMATIGCIGAASIDRVFQVAAIPPVPTKVQATGFREDCGGAAASAAATVAALGHRARLVAALGDDANGARLERELAARGVDVSGLARVAGAATLTAAAILAADGGRLVATHRGAIREPEDRCAAGLGACDALVADPSCPVLAARVFADAAARGVPRVLELPAPGMDAGGLAALSTHAVVLAPGADPRAALAMAGAQAGARIVLGTGFSIAWAHGEAHGALPPHAAAPAAARPSPGVFAGALALALALGAPLPAALSRAARAAALEAVAARGWEGLPAPAALEAACA